MIDEKTGYNKSHETVPLTDRSIIFLPPQFLAEGEEEEVKTPGWSRRPPADQPPVELLSPRHPPAKQLHLSKWKEVEFSWNGPLADVRLPDAQAAV